MIGSHGKAGRSAYSGLKSAIATLAKQTLPSPCLAHGNGWYALLSTVNASVVNGFRAVTVNGGVAETWNCPIPDAKNQRYPSLPYFFQ